MKDLNKNTFGLYLPSFFCMKIETLTFGEEMTEREISLFIHEYVHFLQSFTTIYGLECINSNFSVIANIINWIKEQRQKNIKVPVSEEVLNTKIFNNNRISKLTWGDNVDISHLYITNVEIDDIQIDEKRKVKSVALIHKDEYGEESYCSFGAREINECMAYLMEQCITKDYEKSPDHPYCTVVKVTNFLYPQLLNDKRNLFVICDKALMSSNPGAEYVQIVKWLSEIKFIPSTPDELFFFLDANWVTYDMGEKTSMLETFMSWVEIVRFNLHSLIQDEHFKGYHTWVDTIFDYAIDLRKTEPMFWLDIVDNGYVKDNMYFQAILHFAGSPLIETIKHEYFFVNPNGCDTEYIPYFKVFCQIFQLLSEGKCNCELIPWCHNSPRVVNINNTCYNCPWRHKESNGELCPFKAIWQHWGLNPIEIIQP